MVNSFKYLNINETIIDYSGKNVIIYGKGITGLYALIELKAANVNVIGYTDSYSVNGDFFAGLRCYGVSELRNISNLVIYIAVNDINIKRDILYLLESLELTDAVVACRGIVYGAGNYDINRMKKKQVECREKIQYILNNLEDDKSRKTFNNLISYQTSNERILIEEIFETNHKQYFPINEIFSPCDNEFFIDAGGYAGETTIDFVQWTKKKYKKSIIMEADNTMFNICKEMIKLKKLDNVEVVNKAAYSSSTKLCFDNSHFDSGSGKLVKDENKGRIFVDCISIDKLLGDEKEQVTYIKMDIEGAEMEALLGAKSSIKRNHPKLAISIYHKEDDLWEIPYYLMQEYPFYKFYMRHYTPYTIETILYAAPE